MDLFGCEIRPARSEDFRQARFLFDDLDGFHRRAKASLSGEPVEPPRKPSEFAAVIAGPDSTMFVAEDMAFGHVVGVIAITLRLLPALPIRPVRRVAEIDDLSVAQHARRRGVGRGLVRAAVGWAAERGHDKVELDVHEFNASAIEFYRALGFESVARRLRFKVIS